MAKRTVKLGSALDWSAEEIEQLIEINPADIEAARVWWQDNAPHGFLALLEATLDLDQDQLTDGTV